MTQPIDDTTECGLHSFERNRFFHGKLMTARDMEAEQRYHRNRLRTLAEHVTGEGIVCGLETRVEADEDSDSLVVTVEPGLAIDSCGHPIVVETTAQPEIDLEAVSDPTSLYLDYDNCVKETVPIPGSEDACEEECTYNRILEIFEVTHEPEPPSDDLKPVEAIDFPDRDQFSAADARDPAAIDAGDDALREIAASYAETDDGELRSCDAGGDHRVFLGRFEEADDGTWSRVEEDALEARPLVYSNDMLYAAVARHAARFDNPHDVTAGQSGALVSVGGVSNPGGDVDLRSPDDTLAVDADDEANRIDLDVSDRIRNRLSDLADRVDGLEERLAGVERQLLKSTLHHKRSSFRLLAEKFGSGSAERVVDLTNRRIEQGVHDDVDEYLVFAEEAFEHEQRVAEELAGRERVSEAGLRQYRRALRELSALLEGEREEGLEGREVVQRVAHAQGLVAETAEWIQAGARREEPTPDEEPTGNPAFTSDRYSVENGETATIDIRPDGEEELEVRVTHEGEIEYGLEARVRPRGLDRVRLRYDTSLAGDGDPDVLTAEGDAQVAVGDETPVDGALDPSRYRLVLLARREGEFREADSAALRISSPEEPSAEPQFTRDVFTVENGGTAAIQFATGGEDVLGVRIGDEAEDNYQLDARLQTLGLDRVTLDYDTSRVGNDDPRVLTAEGDAAVSVGSETSLDGLLDPAGYDVSLLAVRDGEFEVVDIAVVDVQEAPDEPSEPSFDASLQRVADAYGRAAETFDTGDERYADVVGIAETIARRTGQLLQQTPTVDESLYRDYVEDLVGMEVRFTAALVETRGVSEGSLGDYAVAVDRLRAAIENGADTRTVRSARDAVSAAAAALEPIDGSFRLPRSPGEYTVSDGRLRQELSEVTTVEDAEVVLAAEMAQQDRVTAREQIRRRIRELESA